MDGAGDASFVMRCCKIPSPSLFPTEPTHHNTQERQNSLNLIYRKSNQTINGWNYIKKPFSGRLAPFSGIQLPDTWNVHQFSPTNAAAESPHVIFVCFRRRRGELSPLDYLAIDAKLQISFSLICIQWFPVAQRAPSCYQQDWKHSPPSIPEPLLTYFISSLSKIQLWTQGGLVVVRDSSTFAVIWEKLAKPWAVPTNPKRLWWSLHPVWPPKLYRADISFWTDFLPPAQPSTSPSIPATQPIIQRL